jgi:hypothetical protein
MKKFSTVWGLVACVVLGSMFYDYSKSHKENIKPPTQVANRHDEVDVPAELRQKMEVLLTQSLIIKQTSDSHERNKLVDKQIQTLEESLALVRGQKLTDDNEEALDANEVLKMERELKMLDTKVKVMESKMSRLQQAYNVNTISDKADTLTNNQPIALELSI